MDYMYCITLSFDISIHGFHLKVVFCPVRMVIMWTTRPDKNSEYDGRPLHDDACSPRFDLPGEAFCSHQPFPNQNLNNIGEPEACCHSRTDRPREGLPLRFNCPV